jgi:P-type Mg2+ transporter
MKFSEYTIFTNQELETIMQTSLKYGLRNENIAHRLEQYGYNELPDVTRNIFFFFLRQMASPFLFVLVLAAILALFLQDFSTASMIILILIINALIGSYQEYKADRSARLLKKLLVSTAHVIRNGHEILVQRKELVPGDVVIISPGTLIPTDLRLIQAHNLSIDESMLTGEAIPAIKEGRELKNIASDVSEAKNIAFAGTTVMTGRGIGVVIATGTKTMQGGIGHLTEEIVAESVFVQDINRFTKVLLWFIVLICLLILIVHMIWATASFFDVILFVLALAISITPESLPIVILFTLSKSARALAYKKVIVKRLSAVNDLGAVQILCVDKTGTLTENKMAVAAWQSHDATEAGEKYFFLMAALASERQILGLAEHSLDAALWHHLSDELRSEADTYTIVQHIPFDPTQRSNRVIIEKEGRQLSIVRGALEVIAEQTKLSQNDPIFSWAEEEGKKGRRVLAVGVEKNFLGAISFTDPIKKTVKKVLQKAKKLNVSIKVLTGDSREVAATVARESGILEPEQLVLSGKEFELLSPEEAEHIVHSCAVFARVNPEQKYRIIQLLQKKSAVGFLGDGINDVLALKIAHVGISVQGSADIAREAADIILLKKSLTAIIDGIQAGREAVANTKKYIIATLASNVGNATAIACGSLIIRFLPLKPIQLLILNLISDLPMLTIAYDSVDPDEVSKPARFDVQRIFIITVILGWTSSIFDFILFYTFSDQAPSVLQTYWFIGSILTEIVFIMSIRTKKLFVTANAPAISLIIASLGAIIITILLTITKWGQHFFYFVPPAWWGIKIIIYIVGFYLLTTECVKLLLYRHFSKIREFIGSMFN